MKITKEKKRTRDKIISDVWELNKAEMTMQELAPIFHLNVDTIYKILKEAREKKIINN